MSKAFTREDDDAPERPLPRPASFALPPGVKNYLTADGARRMREELAGLLETGRPRLAAQSDGDEARQSLLDVDQRIRQLQQALHAAVVVSPPAMPDEQRRVRFGATVIVRRRDGSESSYRLVGAPEVDLDRGWVSFFSPIARALLNAQAGQRVQFKFPSGEEELEIVGITYEG